MKASKTWKAINALMQIILRMRTEMKQQKRYEKADGIRKELEAVGFEIKDQKNGSMEWSITTYEYKSII